MVIRALADEPDFQVVQDNQDCRGWAVVDERGRAVGRVNELFIDTEQNRVASLRLDDGVQIPVERVTLLDGTVVLEDAVVVQPDTEPNLPATRRSTRWSELPVQRRGPVNFATFEEDFRRHYRSVSDQVGRRYEDLLPAYRHGYELARAERFRGRAWDAAETDARREWESLAPEMPWPEVRVVVQGAWDRVRGGL